MLRTPLFASICGVTPWHELVEGQDPVIRVHPAEALPGFLVQNIAIHRGRFEPVNLALKRLFSGFKTRKLGLEGGNLRIETTPGIEPAFAMDAVVAEIAHESDNERP